jgi:hypothetical protein
LARQGSFFNPPRNHRVVVVLSGAIPPHLRCCSAASLLLVAWLLLDVLHLNGSNKQEKVVVIFPPLKSKRAATATATSAAKKSVAKKLGTKPLSLLGFSSSERTTIQIGAKLLLNESIYLGKFPPSVKEHMFVYEIVQVHDTGKLWKVQYTDQVVRVGGDKY